MSSNTSVASTQQLPSCPTVDVEWPPRSSLGVTAQLGNIDKLKGNKVELDSSFIDIDPFANWSRRPSRSCTPSESSSLNNYTPSASSNDKYGLINGVTTTNELSFHSSSWAFGTQTSSYCKSQNQGIITSSRIGSLSSGGLNSHNSLGYLKQNHSISSLDSSTEKAADLKSMIFAPNNNEQIAPPPTTAVGKSRGRGRGIKGQIVSGSASLSGHMKSQAEKPLLLG